MRAAMRLPMRTVGEPMRMTSGGPTQVSMSVIRAAGRPPIRTVGSHGGRMGPPTCGTTPVTMGQTCMSVMRAAGGMICFSVTIESVQFVAFAAVVGLVGIFWSLGAGGTRAAAGTGGASAVDQHQRTLNGDAGGADVDEASGGFDG